MKKIIMAVIIIILPVYVLLFVFETAVFDLDYFKTKFIENNTMEITGLDINQLMRISDETLKYLEDDRENLILYEELNGDTIQVFEERELNHMEDVKVLFDYGYKIKFATMYISILCLGYLFIKNKYVAFKAIRVGSILYLVAIGIIVVLAYIDFNRVFVIFHKILFTNDLWLLNPKEDIMIQMLPLDFFMGIGIKIAIMYLLYIFLSVFISTFIMSRNRNSA